MWQQQWNELRDQLQRNMRLRLTLWAVVAILWVYALLMASDALPAIHGQVKSRQSELASLQRIESPAVWTQREADARSQWQALAAMGWDAAKAGLAAAEVQDWLRQTGAKAGIVLKEVRAASAQPGTSGAADLDEARIIRVRLSLEFAPMSLAAFMQELGQIERGIVVERLQFKAWSKPAIADIDLRIPLRGREGSP